MGSGVLGIARNPSTSADPYSNCLASSKCIWYKINFDGAFFVKENCAGVGAVIRNEQGLVMASLSQKIPLPFIVIEVEALAARRAVKFAAELGLDQIVLEGDSEILINTLQHGCRSLAQFGH